MKEENSKSKDSLLSVIPKRLESREFFIRMNQVPPFMTDKLPDSKSERRQLLDQLVYDWFHVRASHYDLYERLHDIITQSYRLRDQIGPDKIIRATVDWFKHSTELNYIPPKLFTRPVEGMALLGISGTGKSTCTEAILEKCFPKIVKRDFTTQIVHLKINCTSIGSVKSLCHSFFYEIDRLINSSYVDQFKNSRYNSDNLITAIANVGARHNLGVLIIDEIHHLNAAKGYNKEQIINFLKNLNSVIGIPIVYIGTPEAVSVLTGNFQQARRAQGMGSVIWDRFHKNDLEWNRLLEEIWEYQVLKRPGKLTEELKLTYYNLTQGIFDILVKLHVCAQKRALAIDLESIDCGLLETVAKDDLSFVSPMINALRTNDPSLLSAYTDISTRIIEMGKRIHQMDSRNPDVKMLTDLLLQRFPNLKEDDIAKSFAAVHNKASERKKSERKKVTTKTSDGLLPGIFKASESKEDLIGKLRDQGVIKPISALVQL